MPLKSIPVVRDVLEESNARAAENRALFQRYNVFVVNIMSSPGAGKTMLLEKTIPLLKERDHRCAVIEGDITSTLDADRLQPLGVPVVQANTEPFGGDCHLGSHLVQGALKHLHLEALDFLFIENIGNLVCPAEFDLGENRKVVLLSLPEGEDKPLKYPLMFRESQLCLITKMDIESSLGVSAEKFQNNICMVNGRMKVIRLSAKDGSGMGDWVEWLLGRG